MYIGSSSRSLADHLLLRLCTDIHAPSPDGEIIQGQAIGHPRTRVSCRLDGLVCNLIKFIYNLQFWLPDFGFYRWDHAALSIHLVKAVEDMAETVRQRLGLEL